MKSPGTILWEDGTETPAVEWEPAEVEPGLGGILNAFCPTGPGGGIDPTCSPGEAGSGGGGGSGGDTPEPVEYEKGMPNPKEVKVLKALGGSTGAKLVEDPNGTKWVMKSASGSSAGARLQNEIEADELYRQLNIAVPESGLVDENSGGTLQYTKFGKFMEGSQTLEDWRAGKTKEQIDAMHKEIGKGFVADALLSNWDVVGLTSDNILIHEGKPYRADNGGALKYRAQGTPKFSAFTDDVGELDTLRDPAINPSASKVFSHLTDHEIHEQMKSVVSQRKAVLAATLNPETKEKLSKRFDDLEARIEDYQVQFGLGPGTINPDLQGGKKSGGDKPPDKPPSQTAPPPKPTGGAGGKLTSGSGIASHVQEKMGNSFSKLQYQKMEFLNPEGVKDNTFFAPLPSKAWTPEVKEKMKNTEEELKKILPPGTQVKFKDASAPQMKKAGMPVKKSDGPDTAKELTKGGDHAGVEDHSKYTSDPNNPPKPIVIKAGQSPTPSQNVALHQLPSKQRSAVQKWSNGMYTKIRKEINSGNLSDEAKDLLGALENLPSYEGNVARGIKVHSDTSYGAQQIQAICAAGVGGEWKDTAPMSMSRSPAKAHDFSNGGLLLNINSKTGRSIEDISFYKGEKEVIGRPGVRYKITRIVKNAKLKEGPVKLYVELDELPGQ